MPLSSKTKKPSKTKKLSKNTKHSKKHISPSKANVIYLDNNGTTKLCKEAKKEMVNWLESRANPSSDSIISKKSKELIEYSKKYILKHCGTSSDKYEVIFTSGASESNCFILRSVVEAYKYHTGKKPHIITSSTEHKSIIKCCKELSDNKYADITYIEPNAYGCINSDLVKRAITKDTALISIMMANNEIGCINNVKKIGEIAHEKKIPFHTDAVQIFGKYKIHLESSNIDAISMSFHKLYGPMGIGLLILNNDLVTGYGLKGQISGSQQNKLRGGTENVPAIAGSIAAMESTFMNRDSKNKKMYMFKKQIINELKRVLPLGDYKSYFSDKSPTQNEFIVMGPSDNGYRKPTVLPNTLMLSFAKNNLEDGKEFCNIELKKKLDNKNIIVSIGSACNTSDKNASHILYAIRAPDVVKKGIVRISLSDNTTKSEIDKFVKELTNGLDSQNMLESKNSNKTKKNKIK